MESIIEQKKSWRYALPAISAAMLLAAFPSFSGGVWCHLTAGQYILTHGIPKLEPFLYASTKPWINPNWLPQILNYILYDIGGTTALILGRMALVGLAAGLWWRVALKRGANNHVATLCIIGMVAFSSFAFHIHPLMFGPIFFAGILMCLTAKNQYWKIAAVLIQIMWVNTHFSFPLGLLVVGAFLLENLLTIRTNQAKRHLKNNVFLFLIMTLATLINPFGFHIWIELYNTITQAPIYKTTLQNMQVHTLDVQIWIIALLVTAMTTAIAFGWKRRLDLPLFFLLLAMTWLTASTRQMILYWGYTAAALLAVELSVLLQKSRQRRLILVGFWGLSTAVFLWAILLIQGNDFKDADRFPNNSITFLKQHKLTGQIACDPLAGGFISFYLPDQKMSTDLRLQQNDPKKLNAFFALQRQSGRWEDVVPLKRDLLLVSTHAQAPLKDMLNEWAVVQWDEAWTLWMRRTHPKAAALDITFTHPHVVATNYATYSVSLRNDLLTTTEAHLEKNPHCGAAHFILGWIVFSETLGTQEQNSDAPFIQASKYFYADMLLSGSSRSHIACGLSLLLAGEDNRAELIFSSYLESNPKHTRDLLLAIENLRSRLIQKRGKSYSIFLEAMLQRLMTQGLQEKERLLYE